MTSTPKPYGPRLEALLDRRDRLRIKINLAEKDGKVSEPEIAQARSELLMLNREIMLWWDNPGEDL